MPIAYDVTTALRSVRYGEWTYCSPIPERYRPITAIFLCGLLCSNAPCVCMGAIKIATKSTTRADLRTRFPRLRCLRPSGSGEAQRQALLVAARCHGRTRRIQLMESRMMA